MERVVYNKKKEKSFCKMDRELRINTLSGIKKGTFEVLYSNV